MGRSNGGGVRACVYACGYWPSKLDKGRWARRSCRTSPQRQGAVIEADALTINLQEATLVLFFTYDCLATP